MQIIKDKRKISYLYHYTKKENVESIVRTGEIRSSDEFVFFTDSFEKSVELFEQEMMNDVFYYDLDCKLRRRVPVKKEDYRIIKIPFKNDGNFYNFIFPGNNNPKNVYNMSRIHKGTLHFKKCKILEIPTFDNSSIFKMFKNNLMSKLAMISFSFLPLSVKADTWLDKESYRDTSWFDESTYSTTTDYLVVGPNQLAGLLYEINVKGYTFEGKTVKINGINLPVGQQLCTTRDTYCKIDMTAHEWVPISNRFKGVFDTTYGKASYCGFHRVLLYADTLFTEDGSCSMMNNPGRPLTPFVENKEECDIPLYQKRPHNVNRVTSTNGTYTTNVTQAKEGDNVTIRYTPNTGYLLDTITVLDADNNRVAVSYRSGSYYFVMPDKEVTITVLFKKNPDYVTSPINKGEEENGSYVVSTEGLYNTSIYITTSPDPGYYVKEVKVVDANGNNVTVRKSNANYYYFTMPKVAVNVSVTFVQDPSTIPDIIHIFSGNINMLNEYGTKEKPYIAYIGEILEFYYYFTEDEYSDARGTLGTTVYDNDFYDNNVHKQVVSRLGGDVWTDNIKKLNFAFKAENEGLCRVVLFEKDQWGDAIETVYVRVLRPDVIYYKDKYKNDWVINPQYLPVGVGEEVELLGVMSGSLRMDGDKPSTANGVGSGFWSWAPVTINNEWTKVTDNKWLLNYKYTPTEEGYVVFNLGKNGNGEAGGSINVIASQNRINIRNITIGNKYFKSVDKNTASKMFNGYGNPVNAEYNRYTVYVGDKLELYVDNVSDYTLESTDLRILRAVNDTDKYVNNIEATFQGVKPGEVAVELKDSTGRVVETLYVIVKYPINVVTSVGEYHKDYLHEYIYLFHSDMYKQLPFLFVTDNDGDPLYVKNGGGEYMTYYLYSGDELTLTTYVAKDEDTDFVLDEGIELLSKKVDDNLTGNLSGLKKITLLIKATKTSGSSTIKVGSEEFNLTIKNNEDVVHHFDFETVDGGSAKITEITVNKDKTKKVVKSVYNAYVTNVLGSKAYDKDGNILADIPYSDYWQTSPEKITQFESTSSYLTNEDGELINDKGKVISEKFRKKLVSPVLKERNIVLKDIDSVVFLSDVRLTPVSKTTIMYDAEGNEISREVEDISDEVQKDMYNLNIKMNRKDIIDALNKCPNHTGLDFTVRIELVEDLSKLIEDEVIIVDVPKDDTDSLAENKDDKKEEEKEEEKEEIKEETKDEEENPLTSIGMKTLFVSAILLILSTIVIMSLKFKRLFK